MLSPLHLIIFLTTLCLSVVSAEQAQYCIYGSGGKPNFCMAAFLYHNHTTSSHDLYLTMEIRRSRLSSTSDGWTAIGTGSTMQGALMFALYGDPENEARAPTFSVRTVDQGHQAPRALDHRDDLETQVLNSSWIPSKDYYIGKASAICYNCASWHDNAVSTESASQPWIYAFNPSQDLSPYTDGEELRGHSRDGMGLFYIDMASATTHHGNTPPEIDHTISQKYASDEPITPHSDSLGFRIATRPIAYLHGLFMCVAFLVLFPAGVVAIRSGSSNAFRHHWAIQGAAMLCVLVGAGMGLALSGSNVFGSTHQKIGIVVSSLVVTQICTGWWHHVKFVQIRRRTYISYIHMTFGWSVLVGGWTNVLLGLALFRVGKLGRVLVGVFMAVEMIALVGWVYIARKRARISRSSQGGRHAALEDPEEEYFVLDDDADDSEDEVMKDRKLAEESHFPKRSVKAIALWVESRSRHPNNQY